MHGAAQARPGPSVEDREKHAADGTCGAHWQQSEEDALPGALIPKCMLKALFCLGFQGQNSPCAPAGAGRKKGPTAQPQQPKPAISPTAARQAQRAVAASPQPEVRPRTRPNKLLPKPFGSSCTAWTCRPLASAR